MKKLLILSVFTALILSACGTPAATQDISVVQTDAVRTVFAEQTINAPTSIPPTETQLPEPTATERPADTATPRPSVEEVRQSIIDAVVHDLANFEDVETISLVRFNEGALEIELKTRWASQDRQPDVSWTVVSTFADAFADFDKENMEFVAGGPFKVSLTTYSTDGDYRYQSITDWDTIVDLANNAISYDEWVAASGAGFK